MYISIISILSNFISTSCFTFISHISLPYTRQFETRQLHWVSVRSISQLIAVDKYSTKHFLFTDGSLSVNHQVDELVERLIMWYLYVSVMWSVGGSRTQVECGTAEVRKVQRSNWHVDGVDEEDGRHVSGAEVDVNWPQVPQITATDAAGQQQQHALSCCESCYCSIWLIHTKCIGFIVD